MAEIYYKVQGTADESANVGVIKAASNSEARRKLATIYGEAVESTIIDEAEFNRIEQEKGKQLTHRPE